MVGYLFFGKGVGLGKFQMAGTIFQFQISLLIIRICNPEVLSLYYRVTTERR